MKNKQGFYNKILKTLFFCALAGVQFLPVYAQNESDTSKAFNLTTVVDNFLNLDGDSKSAYDTMDEKTRLRQEFIETKQRFNQGNVSVAYNDYSAIINEMTNDIALFVIAKSMYETGFFTLGDLALSKIKKQEYFLDDVNDLKSSYAGNYPLDKQEEIFLAKAYASIYFDNTPEETAFDLSKKTGLLEKSDYANFIMAQALLESRQYQQALMFIENAILKNPKNPQYISYKIEILNKSGKHKEALKFLEKYENSEIITPEFENKLMVQKETILSDLASNENEKKFHLITINYINGDHYKVINECKNILNFNKNNHKILTLQGKSFLELGEEDLAKKNFLSSFEINKNYAPTLEGLGDVAYIEGDSLKAVQYYKKALKTSKNNTIIMSKLVLAYKNIEDGADKIAQLENNLKKLKKNFFYENYLVAVDMLKNNPDLKKRYLIKSLNENLLFESAQNEYLTYLNENKRQKGLQNFLHILSFMNNNNYAYYYYRGIVDKALGSRDLALLNVKHCISMNPDYEPAEKFLGELEAELLKESTI